MATYHKIPKDPTGVFDSEGNGRAFASLPSLVGLNDRSPVDDNDDEDDNNDDVDDDDEGAVGSEVPMPRSAFELFYATFFRILSPLELGLAGLAVFLEVLRGILIPVIFLALGDCCNALHELDAEDVLDRVTSSAIFLTILAVSVGVVFFVRQFVVNYVCHSVATKYEKAFMYHLSRADMVWLDNETTRGIEAWMDVCGHGYKNAAVRGGLEMLTSSLNIVGSLIVAFTLAWQLALAAVVASGIYLLAFSTAQRMLVDAQESFDVGFAEAEAVLRAALHHIRLIYAFGMEDTLSRNMDEKLVALQKIDARRRAISLSVQGILGAAVMSMVGLTGWFTGTFVVSDPTVDIIHVAGTFVTVFFVISNWTSAAVDIPTQIRFFLGERQRLVELNELLFDTDESTANYLTALTKRTPDVNGGYVPVQLSAEDSVDSQEKKEQLLLKQRRKEAAIAHHKKKMQRRAAQKKARAEQQSPQDDDDGENLVPSVTVDEDESQPLSSSSTSKGGQERQAEDSKHSDGSENAPNKEEVQSHEDSNEHPEVGSENIDNNKEVDVAGNSTSDRSEDDDADDVVETLAEADKMIETTAAARRNSEVLEDARLHRNGQEAWTETKTNYDSSVVINVNSDDGTSPSGSDLGQSETPSDTTDLSTIELTDKRQWDIELKSEQSKREAARRKAIAEESQRLQAAQPAASIVLENITFTRNLNHLRDRVMEHRIQCTRRETLRLQRRGFASKLPSAVDNTTKRTDIEDFFEHELQDMLQLDNVSFAIHPGELVAVTGPRADTLESLLHVVLNLYPTHHFRVREEVRRPAEPELGTTDLDTSVATPAIIDGSLTLSVGGIVTLVSNASVDEKDSAGEPKLPTSPSMVEVRSKMSINSLAEEQLPEGPSMGDDIYVGQEHLARGIKIGVFAGRRRYLVRGTVTENITVGRRGVTEADVLRACQDVRLAKRIQLKYKTGFKQVIDPQDRGPNGLSDLECCQVLLARALVGAPSLIVLDRPFQLLPRGTIERALFKKILQSVLGKVISSTVVPASASPSSSRKRAFTAVARFDYPDDARDCTTRALVFDQRGRLIEDGTYDDLLKDGASPDSSAPSFPTWLARVELNNFGDGHLFSDDLDTLCEQLRVKLASEVTATQARGSKAATVASTGAVVPKPRSWFGDEPLSVTELSDVQQKGRPQVVRLICLSFPKMLMHFAVGGLLAVVLGVVYPLYAYLVVDIVRTLGTCNPVTIPFFVDLNITVGIDVQGTFDHHNVSIHDRCFDYPYSQSALGEWSTTDIWLDHAGYSCGNYSSEGWCDGSDFSGNLTVETIHVDADSDGFCDVTGDNCTFVAIDDPETSAIEDVPKGPPFETGSGRTSYGCDCNSTLDWTGRVYGDPWYANMTCCDCGGGKMVNTFVPITAQTHTIWDAIALVEFFANVTLYGCSSYKVGAETVLDCDGGVMELDRCISDLSASTASGFELFLLVAAVCVFGWVGLGATIGRVHAHGTRLVRQQLFQSLLVQDVEWHDRQTADSMCNKPSYSLNLLRVESHDGSVVPDEIFDESTASNKSQSSSSAMHVRRKGIPFREERFRQPGENDSGLVRMWKEGASEANNAVLDAIIIYFQYFIGLGVVFGFGFNLSWEMALLFVGLQLLLLGVFVVLQCCPLYAGAPLQASLRSQRHAQEFLHQMTAGRHLLRPTLQWSGQKFDLPLPPPTRVAVAFAKKEHEEEVAEAQKQHAKLQAAVLKAQQKGMVPRGAPRIKQVYAYQKFFKMLRDGIPSETVKEKMVGEGLNPAVLDLPGEAVDPAWPVFVQPQPRGPPTPVLNLSEDIDDPRLPWMLRKFDDLRRPGRSQRLLLGAWNAFHFAWPVTSQLAVLAAACFLSLQLLGARRASGSGIFAVVFLGMLTVRHLGSLSSQRRNLQKARKVVPRIFSILDRQPFIDPFADVDLVTNKAKVRGSITFANVTFRYPSPLAYRDALHDVNFAITAGQSCGIVGTRGSGKTTLLHLILRLYDPTTGKVELDGISLVASPVLPLRELFGFMPTEPLLFEASFLDNLTLGKKYPPEVVHKVLTTLELHELVAALPSGIKTIVSGVAGLANLAQADAQRKAREEAQERAADELAARVAASKAAAAAGLSPEEAAAAAEAEAASKAARKHLPHGGGFEVTLTPEGFVVLDPFHAQLLSLGRLLLREPKVYLFDSVMRHINSPDQRKQLQTMMDKVSELETTITVSDQVASVVEADKILVMHRGEIVEQGTHVDMVLEGRELYTSLCAAQKVSTDADYEEGSE